MLREVAAIAVVVAGCKHETGWQRVAVHEAAARQPTATGRAIMRLCPWQQRLYIGYGDYQENTGPIEIAAWDPARGAVVTVHTSDSEAIYNYRPIGDQLYAPATDRREHADYAVGEPWRDERPVTSAHAYDMATFDGNDLWLVGSEQGGEFRATAWRSIDHGAHWMIARQTPATGRYYFAAVYHHELYLEAWWEVPAEHSDVFDGTTWRQGPQLLPTGGHGDRPVVFADRLVYATKQTFDTPHAQLAATPDRLVAFDGTSARVVFDGEIRDFFAANELYVLDANGEIWRTADLARWTLVASTDGLAARSLALFDGALYIGTASGELYRRNLP